MKIEFKNNRLVVTKEDGDKKYYGTGGAKGESNFLHALKVKLNAMGFDLIKKRMWKDGHLVDDMQQYLTTRNKKTKGPHIYLWNTFWNIRGLNDDWNEGSVEVGIEYDVYGLQPDCIEIMNQLFKNWSFRYD